jgi:hypothetical protein
MSNNTAALNRGFSKMELIIRERITKGLIVEADKLAMKAYETYHSPLMGFTGQTWTGTAVGVFSNRSLAYYVSTRIIANMPNPVRKKLSFGKPAFLKEPYGYIMDFSGNNRFMRPTVATDEGISEQDAIKFLQSYHAHTKYAIVVVNGSEYANYIENSMGGDVITGTYHYASRLRAVEISHAV